MAFRASRCLAATVVVALAAGLHLSFFVPSTFLSPRRRLLLFCLYVSLFLFVFVSAPSLETARLLSARAAEEPNAAAAAAEPDDDAYAEGSELFADLQSAPETHSEGSTEFRVRMQEVMTQAGDITDQFMVEIASLTAQIDTLRMEVNNAKGELNRLNELFDDKTEKTLRMIGERIEEFSSDLEQLEADLSEQLKPGTGIVFKRLEELRTQLLKSRAEAESHFHSEAYSLMRQVDTCSARVDELTRVYFDLRNRTDLETTDMDARMIKARHELEDLVQQRVAVLAASEQRITAEAVKRLVELLKNLRLEENMLQDIVRSIQRQFLEPSTVVGRHAHREKGATFIDLSSSFADSKIEKVCVVMTHHVQQLLPGKIVIPIFIHIVPPVSRLSQPNNTRGRKVFSGLGGARALLASLKLAPLGKADESDMPDDAQSGVDEPSDMVIPDEQIIAAGAAQWLQERQAFGARSDHYVVVRVHGLLMEYYTVPTLQYQQFSYARPKNISVARPEHFAERLEEVMHSKLRVLEAALDKDTFLLIGYLGEATGHVVQPRASLLQTANRVAAARSLEQDVTSSSVGVYSRVKQFKHQLRFIDDLANIYARLYKKNLATRAVLQGDEIEVVVVVGGKAAGVGKITAEMPPCREDDPFFRQAFTVLSMNLTAVTQQIFAFPSDMLLAKALSGLVSGIEGGVAGYTEESSTGRSSGVQSACGAIISTSGLAKRVWRQQVLRASLSVMRKSTPAEKGGGGKEETPRALTEVPVVKGSIRDAVEANLELGYLDLPAYIMEAIVRVMRDRLEFVSRGYTFYVIVNVSE
ncbi:hypothetical protein BESB_003620 [Besnoitia besnoiti]|uniref:Microtubule-binding protein n=1 Tax=Besnoitia besnoiti TaxID=94643 RepID=A0A2A9MNC1_BESBE|nr:hypothetical protein BESB_003620 [Besnoitia besnoiti]PFH38021.1 hypothetical protein BESB_003620 [Besnoitia besnoiti]